MRMIQRMLMRFSCLLVVSIVNLHGVIPSGINEETPGPVTRPDGSPVTTSTPDRVSIAAPVLSA